MKMPDDLKTNPIHLGMGARAIREPAFTGLEWYEQYTTRHQSDGVEGRLVSMVTFQESWSMWEMHPHGSEVVICTAGEITLVQEIDGVECTTLLRAGEYAINEPGVWHTANVEASATALFITAGVGTQHRPR
jgi:quercetin dioxygenase-like cupin family protein